MRYVVWSLQIALVAGLFAAILAGLPLGVPGEWTWPRLTVPADPLDLILAAVAIGLYTAFVTAVYRALDRRESLALECLGVSALFVAAVFVQVAIESGAPAGYGLSKWVTLGLHGSSGYHEIALKQMDDPWEFWAAYPEWVQDQDALHIGTHPPGLFLASRASLGLVRDHPGLAERIDDWLPAAIRSAFDEILGPLPRVERASLVLMGAATLLLCASTVVPLYLLGRGSGLSPALAWSAAACWPLVTSAILFQPTADTAFCFLSTLALALAAWSNRGWAFALAGGVVLGVGMQISLVFLPVGLIVALIVLLREDEAAGLRRRLIVLLATGAGFLAFTCLIWLVSGADPLTIWWWNLRNHARFYVEYPRSYAPWIALNLVELAVGLGLPLSVWIAIGFLRPRAVPAAAGAALGVIVLLDVSGRNLSEVGRLWLPLMPPLLLAASPALLRPSGGVRSFALTIALLGLQILGLQCLIQVVYPV